MVSANLFSQYQRLTGNPLSGLQVLDQKLVGLMNEQAPFSLDFSAPQVLARMRDARKTSMLKRLEGLLHPHRRILDLTMGFAQDDREFAMLSVNVFAQERNPLIFSLTLDAFLNQLGFSIEAKTEWLSSQSLGWIQVPKPVGSHPGEGILSVRHSHTIADLDSKNFSYAYYDPMFSVQERTALPKKHIQFLLQIVGHDMDQEEFFRTVLAHGFPRVVVKRQAGSLPVVPEPQPHRHYESKLVRLDVYGP